uniref:Histamine N-methyltransferase n=1 Tax=Oncorhynchus tshawytscha TaxID=74940 RepID=A0A8C8LLF2_ONCTS
MSYAMRSLVEDDNRYLKSFQLFLECSSEHPSQYPAFVFPSIGEGKANLHVMGVGSGSGEVDLEMFSELRLKHLAVTVDNQVVEPSAQQLHLYKVLVSQKPNLDYIKFTWNKMTATEFEKDWREKNYTKKMDFIHMIQMLYYVKDPCATVSFYQSPGQERKTTHHSGSGWGKHWKTFKTQLCNTESSHSVTTGDIKTYLDSKTVSYQSYELPSQIDITECFTEGDQRGELLLDFLTEVLNFSSTAPAELKARALELLRHPDCSKEVEGRVIFNNTLGVMCLMYS